MLGSLCSGRYARVAMLGSLCSGRYARVAMLGSLYVMMGDAFFKKGTLIFIMRVPWALQVCRAIKACSPEAITRWYTDIKQFLEVNSLLDKPSLLWHC